MARKLTTADVCRVSTYSRDQVQALLKVLPPYCDTPSSERIARDFRSQDLLLVCVAHALEVKCGVRRIDIAKIGVELHRTLNGPRRYHANPLLVAKFLPPTVQYLETLPPDVEGVVVQLRPIFNRVDDYLTGETHQSALDFGSGLHTIDFAQPRKGRAK